MTEVTTKLFEHWGFEVPGGYGWQKIRCVWHDDHNPSATINLELGAFNCFSCGIKGDLIKLVKEREGLDFAGTTRFIEKITGRSFGELRGPTERFSGRGVSNRGTRALDRHSSLFPDWFLR